jgi:lipoyl(octanoyl) transferase
MPEVLFEDLGLIDYREAWDYQETLFSRNVNAKLQGREKDIRPDTKNFLLFCEHPHVFTLGKSGTADHLLLNEEELIEKHAVFYRINRGGDITYHGPGQIVGYPVFDLDYFFTDIHKYLRYLEEVIILTLAHYDIMAERIEGLTGVWLDGADPVRARKICAMGIRCSRWVTMHGFAFNVNADLDYFNYIIPCGITDKAVTSMEKELGRKVDMEEVKDLLRQNFSKVFGISFDKK